MAHILYIEDDLSISGLVKAIVEKHGHTVDVAYTGADGLAMHDASAYDAIAVDFQLPDMTGIDICRQLLIRDPDMPIVMITGMGDQRLANEALGLGVMNYLQKDTEQVFLELLPSIFVQLLRKGAERKERTRLRAELVRQQERMEIAARIAKVGVWEWSEKDQRLTYMSPEEISILGYTPETIPDSLYTPEGDELCIHPDDLERYRQAAYGVAESDSDTYEVDYRLIRPDGEVRHIRQAGRVERDSSGTAITIFGIDQDITEQTAAQQELAASEARLKAFFQHSPFEVYMKDTEGRYQMANVRFLKAHGMTEEELVGKYPKDIYSAEEAEGARHHDLVVLETGEASESEETAQRTDGIHHLLTVKFPILDNTGNITGVGAVGADISAQKETENALRESEERFRDFSEIGNDWHWELDEDLCYVELTPSGSKAELYPSGQYLGRSRLEARPEGIPDFVWQAHVADLQAHRPFRDFIQPRYLPDGSTIWLSASGKPLFNPDGSFHGYRGTAIDITRQKEGEDALIRAQHLSKIGSWRYTLEEDIITDCSEELALIHGYSLPEFLKLFTEEGMGYKTLVHPDDKEHHYRTIEDAVANKKDWESEFRIIRKDGEIRHMKEYGVVELDIDGNVVSTSGSLQDVTEEKVIAAELEQAREEAESANLAKSEFLSSMSHELRTPLNAILGFSQLMEYNPQEPLTDAQRSSVDHIKKGGEHLLSLINDILDLARIEAGKTELSIEDVPITDCIDECMALVHTMADKRDIDITVRKTPSVPYVVRADLTRLTQVILNLLSNAIKYNRPAGRITVELKDATDDYLRLCVIDTGPGIPDEKHGDLFQPFNRLGAESTDIEGTGIGLVVTKELVELMAGRIGFESALGVGSTFWVELPKSAAVSSADSVPEDAAKTIEKSILPSISGKVLYVEDNPANLLLMEQIIANIEGLSIISAHNAEFGIELAKSQNPNLIIFDINLPGMSGLDAIKELKKNKSVSDIPIIALSAAATQKDIRKGLEAGFDHYLTKPINVAEITKTINAILLPACDGPD